MPEPKSSVPKFGSFRPKPPQDQVEEKDDLTVKKDQHIRKESRSRHRPRKSHSKERGRDRSKDRHHSTKPGWHVERQSPSPKDETVEVFIFDRKGDVKNLVYGSIHQYSIPPFHRAGAGSVLGAPPYVRIDRDYGDERGIVLYDKRDFKATYREKYIFSKIEVSYWAVNIPFWIEIGRTKYALRISQTD